MLQNSLSKILSTISLSALSLGLLGGALSSSCKAMDLDPHELKARTLAGKSLDEIDAKAAKLFAKSEVETEKKDYILTRIESLTTIAEATQLPEDAEGLRGSLLLSAAETYYQQKNLEEQIFGKSPAFKIEKASHHEIQSEIHRLIATLQTLTEIEKECISPQIGALKAYRNLKQAHAPQYLLKEAQDGYYAATAVWKELGGNKTDEKKLEKSTVIVKVNEKEKTASTVSVGPKAPKRIGLIAFYNDAIDANDEYVDDANRVWMLIGCGKLGTRLQGAFPARATSTLNEWYFEPTQEMALLIKAKENLSSFQELIVLEPSVLTSDAYGVRYNLYNPTTKEIKDGCHFFMVLKKNNNQ